MESDKKSDAESTTQGTRSYLLFDRPSGAVEVRLADYLESEESKEQLEKFAKLRRAIQASESQAEADLKRTP